MSAPDEDLPAVPTPSADLRPARPVKRSFSIAGHKTSISLEAAFWDALKVAAREEQVSLAALVASIDRGRDDANLSSAVRVWLLQRALARAVVPPMSG